MQQHTPAHRIRRLELQRAGLGQRMQAAITRVLADRQRRLAVACKSLDTTSPLATLDRGYSIVTRAKDGSIARKATAIRPGEQVKARLAKGQLLCTVDEVIK